MIKTAKLISLFLLTLLLTSSLSFSEKSNFKSIEDELVYLLKAHRKYVNEVFKKRGFDLFDKAFFGEIGFIEGDLGRGFLRNIEDAIASDRLHAVSSISYSSFTSINGVYKAVHYSYTNDGYNIRVSKNTYNNGKVLKAVYKYNARGKLLNVAEYKGSNLVNKKKYSIKI